MSILALLLLGLAAGIVSGLVGVGGGILLTPVLHFVVGLSWEASVLTSLLVISIQTPFGILAHARKGAVMWSKIPLLIIFGIPGVIIGALLIGVVPVTIFRVLFALLLAVAGLRFLGMANYQPREASFVGAGVLGFFAGLVSRTLGVGGGILVSPGLIMAGAPAQAAVATSLVVVWTNSLAGVLLKVPFHLDWGLTLPIVAGAIVGGPLGAKIAHEMSVDRLRKIIGVVMVLASIWIAFSQLF